MSYQSHNHHRHEHDNERDRDRPQFHGQVSFGDSDFQHARNCHHANMGRIVDRVVGQMILPNVELQGVYGPVRPQYDPRQDRGYVQGVYGPVRPQFDPRQDRDYATSYYQGEQSSSYYQRKHLEQINNPSWESRYPQGHYERADYRPQYRPQVQNDEGHYRPQYRQQPSRRSDEESIYTYDGARRSNSTQAMASARVVAEVARRKGVDPVVAVAAMLVESGGNPRAVGDNGHSFGLFQLNDKGELKEARLNPQQAFDPYTNANVALSYFKKGHVSNPGAMAAAAQRPANRADYARKVNSNMDEAERMVRQMGMA